MQTVIQRAFAVNPYMKLFVAEGYYDGATPYYAAEYTRSHMSVDPVVAKQNIAAERYTAGHMMYIDEPSARSSAAASPDSTRARRGSRRSRSAILLRQCEARGSD